MVARRPAPHPDLPEGNQPVKQSDRGVFVGKRRLGFRSASEFPVQIFERVGAAQRLPHRLGEIEAGQQVLTGLQQALRHRRTQPLPLLDEAVVSRSRCHGVVSDDDLAVVPSQLRTSMGRTMIEQVL